MMTDNMAYDLIIWMYSQPVRRVELINFAWETLARRQEILTAVSEIPTLEYFQLCDSDQSSFITIAEYTRRSNTLSLSVSGLRMFGYLPMDETNMTCFTIHFQQLLETKTKTLQIAFLSWHQCKDLVKILTMLLHQSCPEKLEIELHKLTKDDMILLAQDFCHQELFRELP
ncbi:hypothetical protein AC1031_011414 [Aphanomyces cochlioides]|nr:hypothetical protein AC1031_011414 [Aphanomyces cochlioides]